MGRRVRKIGPAESAEIWDRWQRGEGLKLIGRAFGRYSSAIFAHLKPTGGIRPAPAQRDDAKAEGYLCPNLGRSAPRPIADN